MQWLALIAVSLVAASSFAAPFRPLALSEARADANADFVPDLLGEEVEVEGVLTSKADLNQTGERYAAIQDPQASISLHFVRATPRTNLVFAAGDRVKVRGKIEQNRGTDALRVAEMELVSRGQPPAPAALTIGEAMQKKQTGRLVKVRGSLRLAPDFSATKPMLFLKDRTGELPILLMSMDFVGKVEFAKSLLEAGSASVTGVVGQWDNEPPFDNNFFLGPRSPEDFIISPRPPYALYGALVVIAGLTVVAFVLWRSQSQARAAAQSLKRVTERLEQSKASLVESEQRLRGIFENSLTGIFQSSFEGRYLHANRALATMLGYDSPSALLRDIKNIATDLYVDPAERNIFITKLKEQGYVQNFEARFRRKNGEIIWVLTNATIARNEAGEPTHIEGMNVEVTARKEAEEKLSASEALYASLVETIPQPVFRKDRHGKYTFANSAFFAVTGLTPAAVMGKSALELLPEAFARSLIAQDARVVSTGQPSSGIEETVLNGRARTFHVFKTPIFNKEGAICGVQGIWLDITEQRELETQLRQAQKMESIGRLAGGIAHDFNNLLTVIQGQASLALAEPALAPRVRESLEEVILSSEKASNLTRQLLMFSRKRPVQLRTVELSAAVQNMAKLLQRLLGERIEVRTIVDAGSANASIVADQSMLEQVLLNLAVNSRDAMPAGGTFTIEIRPPVEAELRWRPTELPEGGYICLETSDTGVGIPPEHLPHIFEPFFTTKDVGQGTGLGLATVYAIVQQHKGWVHARSEPGQGARFSIFLPVSAPTAKDSPAHAAQLAGNSPGARVLLVEDELAVRLFLKTALERSGFRVTEAANAAEGLEAYEAAETRFDLIVTDVVMPGGKSGKDMADAIRGIDPDALVVFISGYSPEEVFGHVLPPETVFLQKPFTPSVLTQTLRRLLEKSQKSFGSPNPASNAAI
ncbi:MAG TPA: PAS domain S-box protein [Methylomirabilota bacterium]|nr:PAS domain S-box protein [Methylomirabilota bacterium]